MPEEREETRERAGVPPSGPEEGPLPVSSTQRPRVEVRADLLPSLSVLSAIAMLGLPLGWLWARLAPPQDSALASTGRVLPLMVEDYHRFDALGIFLLLGLAAGAISGYALWLLRGRRGPVVLIAGAAGSLLASWLAIRTGAAFAAGLYPPPARPRAGEVIQVAPEVRTSWAVLAQPLALSIAYGLAASWNGLDDLGRRLR